VVNEGSYQTFEEEQEPPHESIEEEDFDEAHHVEDQVHEEDPIGESTPPHEDENLVSLRSSQNSEFDDLFDPPFNEDEGIQASISPSHEDKGMVSCTPFQVFDFCDASFDDLESEEFLEKPLDLVNFSFDEEHDDHKIENIDDFLHIGRHKWDMSCFHFDGDPIYDIDDDSRVKSAELFPLEQPSFSENFHDHFQPYMYINDAYFWQHEEDMFTDLFQPPRVIYYNILMEISSHILWGMIHILLSTWS
jgi:hypothetical protein